MPIQTLRNLTEAERASPLLKKEMEAFDTSITKRFGKGIVLKDKIWDYYKDWDDDEPNYQVYEDDIEPAFDIPEANEIDYDKYLNAEVLLPQGDEMKAGTAKARLKDKDGNVVGSSNDNPILDTRVYEVVFPDGNIKSYAANEIATNMYSQVDTKGYRY